MEEVKKQDLHGSIQVGVSAVSAEGEGPPLTRLLWTEVGPPAVPPHPKLLPSPQPTPGRLRVRLEGVEERGGPVTAYQVSSREYIIPSPSSRWWF